MTAAPATAEKTTTEIQQPPAANLPAAPKPPLVTGGKIAALVPTDLEQAYRLAKTIAVAGFAPKGYLIDPRDDKKGFDENKIMVGILHGMEVGFTPMAALQSIAVINGTPSIWGDGAIALVEASGLLVEKKEWLEGEGDNMAAHCWMLRAGRKEPIYQTFSMAQAARAGLRGKQGPWTQYPQRMLQMRARSWAMRDGFPDVLRGLGFAEEVRDMGDLRDAGDGTYRTVTDLPAPPAPTRAAIASQVQAERTIENDLSRGSDRMPDTPAERGDEPEDDAGEGQSDRAGADDAKPEGGDGRALALNWTTATGEVKEFTDPYKWMEFAFGVLKGNLDAGEPVQEAWDRNAPNWPAVQAAIPKNKVGENSLKRFNQDLNKLLAEEAARDQ